jgi:hypothetical protein
LGGEFEVNVTTDGPQVHPGVAMDNAGDFVIVWSGQGSADSSGVFYQRYEASSDAAGPIVADLLNVSVNSAGIGTSWQLVREQAVLDTSNGPVQKFIVDFGEDLSTDGGDGGPNSVTNPNNWRLAKNGAVVPGGVFSVEFEHVLSLAYSNNLETNPSYTYQAIVTFDGDPTNPGIQPLSPGQYVLTALDSIQDRFTNALDGDYDGVPGGAFNRTFAIAQPVGTGGGGGVGGGGTPVDRPANATGAGVQDAPVVAMDGAGNYVVVWVSAVPGSNGTATDGDAMGDIIAQRYNADGTKNGAQFVVNTNRTGAQSQPDVAMDANGNFVVVWANNVPFGGTGLPDTRGIYYRRFDNTGKPIDTFDKLANVYTKNTQELPAVGLDSGGATFVVTWSGEGQDAVGKLDDWGVWARRFSFTTGNALDPRQVLVNTATAKTQEAADVAIDPLGNYFIVWRSEQQDGGAWGLYGQRYFASGTRNGGEIHLNKDTYGATMNPRIAMDTAGNAIVVWAGLRDDSYSQHVYYRRILAGGSFLDAHEQIADDDRGWNEKNLVSPLTTTYLKQQASVAVSADGHVLIAWSAFGQDMANETAPRDDGIFAHMFDPGHMTSPGVTEHYRTGETQPLGVFRVNNVTAGDQDAPEVAMDGEGNYVAVWVGPDSYVTGIWTLNPTDFFTITKASSAYLDGWSGGWSDGSARGNRAMVGTLAGTMGNDQIVVTGGLAAGSWQVSINGHSQTLNSLAPKVVVDGRGGNNTLTYVGSGGGEHFQIFPDHVVITDATNSQSLTVANITTATIDGNNGTGTAVFHDSPNDDVFTYRAATATASLTSAASPFSVTLTRLANVQIASTSGDDTAQLYDSSGKDLLTINAAGASFTPFTGAAFSVQMTGFKTVLANSSSGNDVAEIHASAGAANVLVADPAYTKLTDNSTYTYQANAFKEVRVFGSGVADQATFHDSASSAADTFTANAGTGMATMLWGSGASSTAYSFGKVEATARTGNKDTAQFYDSNQADTFTADASSGILSSAGVSYKATGFRYLIANATATDGQKDVATLTDTKGSSTFVGTSTYATLSSSKYSIRVNNFDGVRVYAKSGSTDKAALYDSALDDTFNATGELAQFLYGNGSLGSVEAYGFYSVKAFASTGNDIAILTGSTRANSFSGSFNGVTANGTLSGTTNAGKKYSIAANDFEQIRANAAISKSNTASLTDTALANLLSLDGTLAQLTDADGNVGLWADNFGKVTAKLWTKNDKVIVGKPTFTYKISQPK